MVVSSYTIKTLITEIVENTKKDKRKKIFFIVVRTLNMRCTFITTFYVYNTILLTKGMRLYSRSPLTFLSQPCQVVQTRTQREISELAGAPQESVSTPSPGSQALPLKHSASQPGLCKLRLSLEEKAVCSQGPIRSHSSLILP